MDCRKVVLVRKGWRVGEEVLRGWSGSGDKVNDGEEEAGRKNHVLG